MNRRARVLTLAFALLITVVAAEWYSQLDFSLGVLYILPVLVAATVLNRWQTLLMAASCALIRGQFTPGLPPIEYWLRFTMAMLAYSGGGLLLGELSRNRRSIVDAYTKLKIEKEMRQQAEEQLRLLAESSPAAILTLNQKGHVLSANRAANEMLGVHEPDTLVGRDISEHVPVLAGALRISTRENYVRASAAGWARKLNGIQFPIASWFSTYDTAQQRCLAGILVDTSEDMRDRELESFRHFGEYNRLLASAVSHEIRNMCLAIRVVTTNLRQKPGLVEDADFAALSTLVEGLGRMSSFELQNGEDATSGWTDPSVVLEQLRVVIEPDWSDAGGTIEWDVAKLPLVRGDEHSLLQVFLNLSQNSLRAAQQLPSPTLRVQGRLEGTGVVVSLMDSGPGIANANKLFQPFRPDADGSGLGLYISRTIMRSFGGELVFVPTDTGCRFDVKLSAETRK
ncbi:MAG: PAS domain-containing sensor histidine kinase [Acidobacteriota bacterium]